MGPVDQCTQEDIYYGVVAKNFIFALMNVTPRNTEIVISQMHFEHGQVSVCGQ